MRQTPTTPCKLWEGTKMNGYGVYPDGARVHRVEWMRHYGITDLYVLHLCLGNKNCYEITHLYAGTAKQNMEDQVRDGIHRFSNTTECPKGHQYDEVNTYIAPNGSRQCRSCRKKTGAKWAVDNKDRVNRDKREKYNG